MKSVKKEALSLISKLPGKAGWEDIMHELYVRKKIEQGLKAADEGKVLPHEEVKQIFLK